MKVERFGFGANGDKITLLRSPYSGTGNCSETSRPNDRDGGHRCQMPARYFVSTSTGMRDGLYCKRHDPTKGATPLPL